jgi:hypothetical protein
MWYLLRDIILLIAALITAIGAWLALSLNLDLRNLRFLRVLPPVKSYHLALEAIEKLSDLTDQNKWTAGKKFSNQTSYNNLVKQDRGFSDLVKLLRENRYLRGEIDELRYTRITLETEPVATMSIRNVGWLTGRKSGEEEMMLLQDYHDPLKPIRELNEMADQSIRGTITNIVSLLVFVWLALTTFIILGIND